MLPVSVIMAACNAEGTILSAATSILEQDHDDFELIVVDDASTDRTLQILKSHPTLTRARVLTTVKHIGRSAARNLAIAESSYDLIAIMDSDDFALPHRLRASSEIMASQPDVAGVGGQAVGLHDGQLWRFGHGLTESSEIAAALHAFQMPLVHPTMMVRKAAFEEVGGYRENYVPCEDLDFFARASQQFSFIGSEDVWLLYRKPPRYSWHDLWRTEVNRSRLERTHRIGQQPNHFASITHDIGVAWLSAKQWGSQRLRPIDYVEHPMGSSLEYARSRCIELDGSSSSSMP